MCLLILSPGFAHAATVPEAPIVVVESESGGQYREFSNALREALADRGIRIAVVGANDPLPGSWLVISAGMKAAAVAAKSSADSVLNVLIPKAGYEQLLRDFPKRAAAGSLSSVYIDQPPVRQVALVAAAFPSVHNIGILYSIPPIDLEEYRHSAKTRNLNLLEQAVTPGLPLPLALRSLLQRTDALLALPDASIFNSATIRNILLATYRRDVPVVGFSAGYVNAGAVCALSTSPRQIAAQVEAMVSQLIETGKLPNAQYPMDFEVLVNAQVARSLDIGMDQPDKLKQAIESDERRRQ